jgi:hypothetical protein
VGGGGQKNREKMRIVAEFLCTWVVCWWGSLDRLGSLKTGVGLVSVCLISGVSVATELLYRSSLLKTAGLVFSGADLMAAVHYASTSTHSSLLLAQLQLDAFRRGASMAFTLPTHKGHLAQNRPTSDVDPFSSTDFEEAMTFAADIFEFLNQEYAMLACVLGEGQLPAYIAGGSLVLNRLYRTISNRRFK